MNNDLRYVFGPVPSRRLGRSLGVSPIPEKTCNYSCIYCQLGRTTHMTNTRALFFPVSDILDEVQQAVSDSVPFDVVTVVGEGEPTLYAGLGELLRKIKTVTDKPVTVITNAALFYDADVRSDCAEADIVLPSMDAFDTDSWKKIDRPYGRLDFDTVFAGLVRFSEEYRGQLWLEIMLVDGFNTSDTALEKLAALAKRVRHDRLYINTPVRPPAESFVRPASGVCVRKAAALTGGTAIDFLASDGFSSDIPDDFEAVLSIIKRHPMNTFEIQNFLSARHTETAQSACRNLCMRLEKDRNVTRTVYRGIVTYRAN